MTLSEFLKTTNYDEYVFVNVDDEFFKKKNIIGRTTKKDMNLSKDDLACDVKVLFTDELYGKNICYLYMNRQAIDDWIMKNVLGL